MLFVSFIWAFFLDQFFCDFNDLQKLISKNIPCKESLTCHLTHWSLVFPSSFGVALPSLLFLVSQEEHSFWLSLLSPMELVPRFSAMVLRIWILPLTFEFCLGFPQLFSLNIYKLLNVNFYVLPWIGGV